MDRLNNLIIKDENDNNAYDFAHFPYKYINSTIKSSKERILKDETAIEFKKENFKIDLNMATIGANEQVIENKLGLYDLLYRLQIASKNSGGSSILKEKYDRAKAMREIIINTILSMIHTLYWSNFNEYQKSSMPLNRAYDFAIDIGRELVSKFEERLNKEYNIANILESEFGVKAVKKITK